jgi:hypothetical protein
LLKQNRKEKNLINFYVILILRSEEYMVKNIKGGYIIKKSKVLIKKKVVLKVHKFGELRKEYK